MKKEPMLTKTREWKSLKKHQTRIAKVRLQDLFSNDKERWKKFLVRNDGMGILLDYSKNLVTTDTMKLLFALAKSAKVRQYALNMFSGRKINWTEQRAVLHIALRSQSWRQIIVDGKDVMPEIKGVLARMEKFSSDVRTGKWVGHTGMKIADVVNIGIGGSDLGPRMVCEALKHCADGPQVHFVSNVDGADIFETLKRLKPETTLFIVASKTFTTQETMANAHTAKKWLVSALGDKATPKHFVALSTNKAKVQEFGISAENMFEFWDFVGGRYSVWSAVGLSVACCAGFDRFREMLEGGYMMDRHFIDTPLEKNMPVILALLGIWYNNFFSVQTHAVLPYCQYLHRLPAYLQQLDMESNGKTINIDGKRVNYQTGPIIWGEPGTNGQHSFYQLIHQGTKMIPADFIGIINPPEKVGGHHEMLMSNFFAQTQALAFGLSRDKVIESMAKEGFGSDDIAMLALHRTFEGNKPTNSILFSELTPRTLGSLIALYEHKVFVQGVIWRINSFDQWGVELGKKLAGRILKDISAGKPGNDHDISTAGLLEYYLKKKLH